MSPPVTAFTTSLPVSVFTRGAVARSITPRRCRSTRHRYHLYTSSQSPRASLPSTNPDGDEEEPPIFVSSPPSPFNQSALDDISLAAPLSETEREAVRARLPGPVANFLIRRADEALVPPGEVEANVGADQAGGRPEGSRAATAAARRSERARKWVLGENARRNAEFEDESWYREYVWGEIGEGLDEFGRQRIREESSEVSSNAAGESSGDVYAARPVLPEVADPRQEGDSGPRTVPLFAGPSGGLGALQGQQVGYGAVALLVALVLLKLILAFVQFFVSFTFSFLAIFALSAGIFVFFFVVRF